MEKEHRKARDVRARASRRFVPKPMHDHRMFAPCARERGPGALDQSGQLVGLEVDRHHPGADAPDVEQVADEPVHAVSLLADDAIRKSL